MSLLLGAVADDYTGASDLAGTLAGAGLRVVQTVGVPPGDLALPEVDAVVVALKSRSIAADRAVALSLAADAWLRGRGAGHVLFKVCSTFDSTDAGNIGPVAEALAAEAVPLVCPAFPRNRRTVYRGHLFVGDDRLDESPLKDHPLNPMRDSSLVRTLARQSTKPVGLIPLETVEEGAEAVGTRLAALAAKGCGAAIIDAVLDRHLDVLGAAALRGPLSVGASGLGLGLARAMKGAAGGAAGAPRPARDAASPGTLMLAGSCSAATLQQLARAESAGVPVLRLDVEALAAGAGVGGAVDWARERLTRGPALLATSRAPAEVAALQARFGAERVSERLEAALADIAEALAADPGASLTRLIVAGGETSGAVVDRLGFQAFALGTEIAPGVPLLEALGARHAGLSLALKSGNFGGPDFFADAARAN